MAAGKIARVTVAWQEKEYPCTFGVSLPNHEPHCAALDEHGNELIVL